MAKKRKRQAIDVRAFEAAANRLRDLSAHVRDALDLLAGALDAAAEHIRDARSQDERLDYIEKKEQKEHDCECIHCKDTGVCDSGWSEGDTCHCAMGVLRDEAEKAGIISSEAREARAEAAWN